MVYRYTGTRIPEDQERAKTDNEQAKDTGLWTKGAAGEDCRT